MSAGKYYLLIEQGATLNLELKYLDPNNVSLMFNPKLYFPFDLN